MQQTDNHRALWLAVSLGIAGLIVGYGLVLSQHNDVFAATRSCPLHDKCEGAGCLRENNCANGDCDDCPRDCARKQA